MQAPSSGERPAVAAGEGGRDDGGWRRGFWCLFGVQFQGALSDNVFKFLVTFLIAASVSEAERDRYLPLILALFAVPFLLFSRAGGFAADRYPKKRVVVATKVLEVAVMLLGALALWLRNIPLLMVVLFLMSVQSAFFGPSKYGLLPEILPHWRLSWGNGLVGLGTFLAVIGGGVVAGFLAQELGWDRAWLAGAGLVALATVGLAVSLGIPTGAAADPHKVFHPNFFAEIGRNLAVVRGDRTLTLAVAGSVFFWFLAALFGEPLVIIYGGDVLGLRPADLGLLKACMGVGIAVGCAVAGAVSGRKIEYGLVPLGAFGMGVGAILLGLPGLGSWSVSALLALVGFAGGFFSIPLVATIQHRPDPKMKGSVLATHNWLTWIGILGASGAFALFRNALGLSPNTIFVIGGLITLAATAVAVRLVPDALVRLVLWALTNTVYRVRVDGRENFPERGGALLVSNQLSLADALLLIAATDRPIRFAIYDDLTRHRPVAFVAKALRMIPVPRSQRPKAMARALDAAHRAVADGEAVCIFSPEAARPPEAAGAPPARGEAAGGPEPLPAIPPVGKGMSRIMAGLSAPLVPTRLTNPWGGIVEPGLRGGLRWRFPSGAPYPVRVAFGSPLGPAATPAEVQRHVDALAGAAASGAAKGRD
jgi:acyl-[acyl-carrier-protein]-phospholipid O-acyltransferase/long-chain-fatty-acid--[acyl-carrier-protein] ligase